MKIIYKQPEEDNNSSLHRFGIQNCFLKRLSLSCDRLSVTRKSHHHKDFELHIVTDGYQEYEIDGTVYQIKSGCFLLIYPNVLHTVVSSIPNTQKYSITFSKKTSALAKCFCGTLTDRIADNIVFVSKESLLKREISTTIIENSILETLVLVFRMSGMQENELTQGCDENSVITLAKQYIDDNIEKAPNVADVSEYCHLSTKQLTRIFKQYENVAPGEYIIGKRVKRIEKLLADQTLSLSQISKTMHFSSEYYFNAFFKKHGGLPPGEYRKMLGI